jgi:CRP/FNR family transcriptional regulator, dissimilatory nitrate respiration regulator
LKNGGDKSFDKLAALRQTALFGGLSDAILTDVVGFATTRQIRPGQLLLSENEEASALYVVVQGTLRSFLQDLEGREQVLSTEGPGAILAAEPLFDGGKFYCTIIADRSSDVLCIEKRDIQQLCREHPELLWSLARVLGHKIRQYAHLVETLSLRNVHQRVAELLLTVCQERAVRNGSGYVIELSMTRTEMASRVGSTREVVCRALAHLQKRGLIQLNGTRLLTVPDRRALSRLAGTEYKFGQPPHMRQPHGTPKNV